MDNKTWVQAAIDVEDIEVAKRIAYMALDAGAEWLEVGTPLLYQYGHSAIRMIRNAVGKDAVLVADYKTAIGGLCAEQAAREGADYILLSAGYNNYLIKDSIDVAQRIGITPIFDLNVRPQDVKACANTITKLGGKYLFAHHYADFVDADGELSRFDILDNLVSGDRDYKLGITSDIFEEAEDAAKYADWIVFGVVLREPNPVSCKQWIDMIHSAR